MAVVNVTRTEAASRRDLVIGLDCDGVLASGQELWEALVAAFPDCIPNDYISLTSYDWPRMTPETTELCLRLSADAEFTRRFSAMPHMAWAIHTLHRHGWKIHIITARPPEVYEATLDWLHAQQIGQLITAVHCVADKAPLAQELGCGAFVEDNLHTAEKLGALGVRSYLMDASYNQAPLQHSIRVSGWLDLMADLGVYQHALLPTRVTAGQQARRSPERGLNRLAGTLLPPIAEPQPAA
ncbi:MAG TPA: hypothetical protein VH599_15750 [Ktedonobacterales bacterium]|jgi:uncharacterized HAD superfamily protein